MHVFFANLGIEKSSLAQREQVRCSSWGYRNQKLSQRSDRWYRPCMGPIRKPGNPCMRVIDRGVQECCALPGNQQSKPGNCVQVESEHCQPIAQPIVCNVAESEHLMNGGDQRRVSDVVIQVVGDMKAGGPTEDLSGLLRYAVQSQASRREDLPHSFSPVHSEGHQFLARITKNPFTVETIATVAAIATSR